MEQLNNTEKRRLYSLFQNIEPKAVSGGIVKEILVIDGLNNFLRAFCAINSLNDNGEHIGGVMGFLKTVGSAIKTISPQQVIIVFDGNGGSQKRRKLYPEYKNKRHTKIHLNRAYSDLYSPEEEQDNIKKQLLRSVRYLDCLPVRVMAIDNVEADDVIAYIAQQRYTDSNINIMSCDKDYLQLVNNRIKVWNPTRKKLYGCAEIQSEYGISCQNFLLYRVLSGDDSDNIDGIKGAGLKTIKKCFPILEDTTQYTIEEMYNYCENHKGKYKLYQTILDNKHIVERNYSLMQLKDTDIQSFTQLRINDILDQPRPKLNRFEFSKLITEDKAWNCISGYQVWLETIFKNLDNF